MASIIHMYPENIDVSLCGDSTKFIDKFTYLESSSLVGNTHLPVCVLDTYTRFYGKVFSLLDVYWVFVARQMSTPRKICPTCYSIHVLRTG
jgi:hypothetical protein